MSKKFKKRLKWTKQRNKKFPNERKESFIKKRTMKKVYRSFAMSVDNQVT